MTAIHEKTALSGGPFTFVKWDVETIFDIDWLPVGFEADAVYCSVTGDELHVVVRAGEQTLIDVNSSAFVAGPIGLASPLIVCGNGERLALEITCVQSLSVLPSPWITFYGKIHPYPSLPGTIPSKSTQPELDLRKLLAGERVKRERHPSVVIASAPPRGTREEALARINQRRQELGQRPLETAGWTDDDIFEMEKHYGFAGKSG